MSQSDVIFYVVDEKSPIKNLETFGVASVVASGCFTSYSYNTIASKKIKFFFFSFAICFGQKSLSGLFFVMAF